MLAQTEMNDADRRSCPFCAEAILPEATLCRFCGRELPVGWTLPRNAARSRSNAEDVKVRRRRPWLAAALSLLAPGVGHLYTGRNAPGLVFFVGFVAIELSSALIVPNLAFKALVISGAALIVADISLRIGAAISAYRATRRLGLIKMGRCQHVWVYICLIIGVPLANAAISPEYHLQSFWIPSGAMVPTLMPGDLMMVDQKHYSGFLPKRGDVIVFKLPSDNSTVYIKRVVGLPGDHIQVQHGILYINNQPCQRRRIEDFLYQEGKGAVIPITQYIETLPNGRQHRIIQMADNGPLDNTPVYDVPPGKYFMMGDNRDNSQDSRILSAVGYIPAQNLIGPAELIYWPLSRVSFSVAPST